VWPRDTLLGRHRFELLSRAYVERSGTLPAVMRVSCTK
jgi:hypothetical protein